MSAVLQVRTADAKHYAGLVARGDTVKARKCYRRGDVVGVYDVGRAQDERGEIIPPAPFSNCVFLIVEDVDIEETRLRYMSSHIVEVPMLDGRIPIVGEYEPSIRLRRRCCVELDELPQVVRDELRTRRWAKVLSIKPLIRDKVSAKRESAMSTLELAVLDSTLRGDTPNREALRNG